MKFLKLIVFWDKKLTIKENVLQMISRIFTFLVPGGVVLYNCLIEKLIDDNISPTAKIGFGGLCTLIFVILIAIYFLNRYFRKKITDLTNEILECLDNDKKKELIQEKRNIEKLQEIWHNALFVAPFIVALVVVTFIEKGLLEMRGTLLLVVTSMLAGFGFNCILQELKAKIKD